MDFIDALIEDRSIRFSVVDWHALAAAWAALGSETSGIQYGIEGAVEWWKRTGELIPGVELEEENK